MESRYEINFGVTVKGHEAPGMSNPQAMAAAPSASKKRGRPRKYGLDGSLVAALSPMPISASIPFSGDYSAWKQPRVKPFQVIKKAHKLEFESIGDQFGYSIGANFMTHIMTVNAGENVAMKIHSFAPQESRAICILSATGSISNVTLRQPSSSGGTLTYEGHFEILSLSGSFMPNNNGMAKSRSGGMSVSLACPDGRVMGGGLAGLLIADSPVQVVLGTFLPCHSQEQKPKSRTDPPPATTPTAVSNAAEGALGEHKLNFTSSPLFCNGNVLESMNSARVPMGPDPCPETENNFSSSLDGESNGDNNNDEDSPINFDMSG